MQSQVDKAEEKVQSLKDNDARNKNILGKDIQKIRLLNDKMRLQKLKIEHEQKKLSEQSTQYFEKNSQRKIDME